MAVCGLVECHSRQSSRASISPRYVQTHLSIINFYRRIKTKSQIHCHCRAKEHCLWLFKLLSCWRHVRSVWQRPLLWHHQSVSKLNAERRQSLCAIQGRLHVCVSELHFRCCFPKVPNGGPCPMPGMGAICQSGNCVERFPFWKIFLWPPAALCKLE